VSAPPNRLAARARPLRVAHVIHRLALGGTEYNVLKLVNRLDRSRFVPFLCSLATAAEDTRPLLAPDVTLWDFHRRPGKDLRLVGLLAERLRTERIDVVHSHNWSTFLYSVVAARLAGVSVVLHGEHGLEVDNLEEDWRRLLARKILSRFTDHFTGVSREICARIQRWGVSPESITFLPNGVELDRFGVATDEAATRAAIGIGPDDLVVTTIGAFRPIKDFATLVRAFATIGRRHPSAHLLLVGSDPHDRYAPLLKEESERLGPAAARVHQLGLRLDTPDLLAITNVYVNCSLYEGMSNTLLEAMACRKPIVATAVGGTPDLVTDGENGFLVSAKDPEAIADRVCRLFEDPELARAQGLRGRARIERKHSFDRMIDLNAGLYEILHDAKVAPMRMASRVKIAVAYASTRLGLTAQAERASAGALVILTYHRILPHAERRTATSRPMILSAELFDRQMAKLARRYRVLSQEDALEHFKTGRRFPDRAVLVTFDDGYADNFEHALPILSRHSIPATFFLTTGPIDRQDYLWWDELGSALLALAGRKPAGAERVLESFPEPLRTVVEGVFGAAEPPFGLIDRCTNLLNGASDATRREVVAALSALAAPFCEKPRPRLMLTWDEVRTMQDEGMTMGAHTVNHTYLDELEDSIGRYEIGHCLDRIEHEIGTRPRAFSFPAGRANDRSRAWLAQAGIELALTTQGGRNRATEDRFALRRWDGGYLCIDDRFVSEYMRLELSGAIDGAIGHRSYV